VFWTAVLMLAGPASADTLTTIPMTIEGDIGVQFRAGPDTGCAAPCDLAGTVTWTPPRSGLLYIADTRVDGRREVYASILFTEDGSDAATASAHVVRGRPGLGSAVCLDARSEVYGQLDLVAGKGAGLTARLLAPSSASSPTDVLGTRCAGPLDADLAPMLPAVTLSQSTLKKGRVTLDFSAASTFATGGMAGAVTSSLKFVLGRPFVDENPDDSIVLLPSGFRSVRRRALTATYSIESMSGKVVTTFAGSGEAALCGALDACGSTGSASVAPSPGEGLATFTATGPRRATYKQLRVALGLSPGRPSPHIETYGLAFWEEDTGTALTSVRNPDGYSCSEAGRPGGGSAFFTLGQRRVQGSYYPLSTDPLSGRCSGPTIEDVTAAAALARGSVPRSAFRRKRVIFPFPRGTGFSSGAYTGGSTSDLSMVLVRRSVKLESTRGVAPKDG